MESYSDTDSRWRKQQWTNQFPRKRKRFETACLDRVIAIEARSKDPKERWKDGGRRKKDLSSFGGASIPPRFSAVPPAFAFAFAFAFECTRRERGHWNLLSDRSPILRFLTAPDSPLSLLLHWQSPRTWPAPSSSSMLPFFFPSPYGKKK